MALDYVTLTVDMLDGEGNYLAAGGATDDGAAFPVRVRAVLLMAAGII